MTANAKMRWQDCELVYMEKDYQLFVDKFKPKKTTDDCYTPPNIYDAAKSWAVKEYGWEGRTIVRPFYPGGDYENYKYPAGVVVIDNPPFSILSQIVKFYDARKIDYFLFAPTLTLFNVRNAKSHIGVGISVIYENGAKVNTSFVSSQGPTIRSAPALYQLIDKINKENTKKKTNKLPKYIYPVNVIRSADLAAFSKADVSYESRGILVSRLDSQRAYRKRIFGSGYLVPEAQAQKAQAQKAQVWELSEREKQIIDSITNAAIERG